MNVTTSVDIDTCFSPLSWDDLDGDLPSNFTFPFYYEPHPIAVRAANQLQSRITEVLETNSDLNMFEEEGGVGKMFGVLVVKNEHGDLGFLSAFSGKWGAHNDYPGFVGPIYNVLDPDGFYKIGEAETNVINRKIEELEAEPKYILALERLNVLNNQAIEEIREYKVVIKQAKGMRKSSRLEAASNLDPLRYQEFCERLDQESIYQNYRLKDLQKHWRYRIEAAEEDLRPFFEEIEALKTERRARSANLQAILHRRYNFINAKGEWKNLIEIFELTDDVQPPSGSGECAAPKLLQHAFQNHCEPIALAEFWWGKSSISEVRKHGHFYPACNGKCKPILGHMLQGLSVDPNPMLTNPPADLALPIIFEDDHLVIINKPSEFLSVPGRNIPDSVYTRLRVAYPEATGPLVVHRLDMSTSGILLIAKSMEVYHHLQSQFIKRKVKKTYTAILDGVLNIERGEINLPLRVDLDDRPRQLVCYEYGKKAVTRWELVKVENGKSRILFYPETGRTHQLRVHAAHVDGLNMPIYGDDIYGIRGERLHLHATIISFVHPVTNDEMTIECLPDF
jgi:tRNA pseudouridine32 synthase / 23S rRNA pseudouridine746 synthase